MKLNTLAWIAGILFVSAAQAGAPDQDPMVDDLRKRFQTGRQPAPAELLKKEFTCRVFAALRDRFQTETRSLKFVESSGYLIEIQPGATTSQHFFIGNSKEVIGTVRFGDNLGTTAYRLDSKGYLVREWSYRPLSNKAELTPLAAAPLGSWVATYGICAVATN